MYIPGPIQFKHVILSCSISSITLIAFICI